MPVSTDGVLLGAWSRIDKAKRILDIGTGTGLLTLMCAQRNQNATIEAIDIDVHAMDAAAFNVEQSPWAERICLYHSDVLNHSFDALFDTIVCNPPYFNSGEQAKSSQRATARHTDSLKHCELLARCSQLLNPEGNANFILPLEEGRQFIETAKLNGWHLKTLCEVKPTERKAMHRLLIELVKSPCEASLESLTIREKDGYSDAFVTLTKDFYLKM